MTRREHELAFARRNAAPLLALLAFAAATSVDAAICKYIDADGAIHYTNVSPDRGWRKLSCDIADDAPRPKAGSGAAKSPTPTGFPRVEPEAQKSRDELRRKVLADELASEEKLLAEARTAYDNGAPVPLAEEQSDAEKYRQRIARLRQAVQLHERNIEALRKELAAVR
jgi:hypothetical protein